MEQEQLIAFLNKKSKEYNKEFFIENDPISVPHRFKKMQDVEIAGFFCCNIFLGKQKNHYQKIPGAYAAYGICAA